MDFTPAIAIFISSALTLTMVNMFMIVSPRPQASIHAGLVRIHPCACNDGLFDDGLDGLLLHIRQEIDDHLPTALYHAKDRWPFLLQYASTTFAFESASTSCAPLGLHH